MTITPTAFPFDSNATGYSLNNAYWLAQAAKIAYQEKSTIQPTVAELGLENFEFLSNKLKMVSNPTVENGFFSDEPFRSITRWDKL